MNKKRWIYVGGKPSDGEKEAIVGACEKFIADILKPRFLPKITPTQFNYPVDIFGKWRGGKYRFMQRFRSDSPDAIKPEFDAPFARLEYVGPDRFDLSYFRHTGRWFRLYRGVSLAEALTTIENDMHFHPI